MQNVQPHSGFVYTFSIDQKLSYFALNFTCHNMTSPLHKIRQRLCAQRLIIDFHKLLGKVFEVPSYLLVFQILILDLFVLLLKQRSEIVPFLKVHEDQTI